MSIAKCSIAVFVSLVILTLISASAHTSTQVRAQSLAECGGIPQAPSTSVPSKPPAANEKVIDPLAGGSVEDGSGKVKVSFDPADTDEPLRIDVTVASPCQTFIGGQRILEQFALNAFAVDRNDTPVHTFANPVTLDVSLSIEQLMPYAPDSLTLYYLNETTDQWEEVEANADYAGGKVTAELGHFSDYALGAQPDVLVSDPLQYFQVNMQSGAAGNSIPISLPSGPSGFTPSLALAYSSSAVDEMKSYQSMASWVGAGWSTTVPTIVRDPFKGRYFLSMDGVSDLLIREDATSTCPSLFSGTSWDCYKWHTKNDQFLDIRSIYCDDDDPWVYHQFLVRTKDGTQYQFGTLPGGDLCPDDTYDPDGGVDFPTSLQYFTRYIENDDFHRYVYRTDVSQIKDTNGNTIDYEYWQDDRNDCPAEADPDCAKYVRAAYPAEIDWGSDYKVVFNPNSSHVADFDNSSGSIGGWDYDWGSGQGKVRNDSPIYPGSIPGGCDQPHVDETRHLNKIEVLKGTTLIRSYVTDYDITNTDDSGPSPCVARSGNLELTELAEKGTDGTTLRTHTFDYADYGIDYVGTSCTSNINGAMDRPYLTEAHNGLGGEVDFEYFTSPFKSATPSGASCGWERLIVKNRQLVDATGQDDQVYVYSGHAGMTYWSDPSHGVPDVDAEYRGFTDVIEKNCTTTGCATVLGSLDCDYLTDGWTAGLTDECSWKASSGSVLKHVDYTYDDQTYTCQNNCDDWEDGSAEELEASKFISLIRVKEDGIHDAMGDHWAEYTYDSYGNVTKQCEYTSTPSGNPCSGTPPRETDTTYATVNTSLYLVGFACIENLYESGSLAASTKSYYDNKNNCSQGSGQELTKGLLTKVDQLKTLPSTYITTAQYTYDSYGNVLTSKDGETDTTTYTYTCGNTVVATEALGGLTTTYDYDETFTSGLDQAGCLFQAPERVEDPAGVDSFTQYDVFGRVAKEWDDLDSESSPTRWYTYDWDQAPIGTISYQKDDVTSDNDGLWTATWMDGFGRAIQIRKDSDNPYVAVSSVSYDAGGRVKSEGTPKLVSGSTSYDPNHSPVDEREYDYDYLGRITKITNPDPNETYKTRVYDAATWYEIDENGNKTQYTNDSFGRLILIEEFNGSSNLYRNTVYTYNAQDLVETMQLRDASLASVLSETSIDYFALGWRKSVTDDDSGETDYTYFNDGQVETRTDARGVVTTYDYDARGRITSKSYSDSTPTIYYYYDSTPDTYATGQISPAMPDGYPEGRLSRVREGPQGSEEAERLFSYDARGNTVMERHRIDSTNYDVGRTYDSADRLETLTYPGSPQLTVTYTYNEQGEIYSLHDDSNSVYYVSSATYNAVGDVDVMGLGGSASTPTLDIDNDYRSNDLKLTDRQVDCTGCMTSNIYDMTYGYDDVGNMTVASDAVSAPYGATQSFEYDFLGRIDKVKNVLFNDTETARDYDFDLLDNMTVASGNADSDVSDTCYGTEGGTCPSGGPHQLTSATARIAGFAGSQDTDYDFKYDSAGNLTTINADWLRNPNNPSDTGALLRFWKTATDSSYTNSETGYDGEGRLRYVSYDRIHRTFFDLVPSGTVTISDVLALKPVFNSHYGDSTFRADYDLYESGTITISDVLALKPMFNMSAPEYVYDYLGNLSRIKGYTPINPDPSDPPAYSSNSIFIDNLYQVVDGITTRYFYAGDQLVAELDNRVLYYEVEDHVGSTSLVTDEDGEPLRRERFLPFGEPWYADLQGRSSDRTFAGYRKTESTVSLFQAGARFYTAQFGRFLSPDPVGPVVGDTASLNPYSYARNNPLTYTDPNGTYPIGIACDRGCPLDEDNPDYPWFVLFQGPGYNNTPHHARDLARAMRGNTQYSPDDVLMMIHDQRQKAQQEATAPAPESRGPVALTDSYCNVAVLFSRNVTCAANQQPPPGGFDLIDAAGAVLDAATSDCATGILSAVAAGTITVAAIGAGGYFIASGGLVLTSASAAATSAAATSAYALSPIPSDTLLDTYSLFEGGISGIQRC